VAYNLDPRSQNIVPNIKAIKVVKRNLTAVYGGFLQYDQCCFHKQAIHCVTNDVEYFVGKQRSVEPGAGVLNPAMSALFLLNYVTHHPQILDKFFTKFLISIFFSLYHLAKYFI
jgi:hypothetical protein